MGTEWACGTQAEGRWRRPGSILSPYPLEVEHPGSVPWYLDADSVQVWTSPEGHVPGFSSVLKGLWEAVPVRPSGPLG